MQITEFTNQMVTLIKSKVSTEMKNVQSHTILKNNGIQEEGITLIEKGVNISPTVYMREYYDRFLQGETLRALAEEVIEELERCKTYKSMDISFFLSFENAKICIPTSSGGHLTHMMLLKPIWEKPGKKRICICINESFCCTAEITTIL